MSTHAEAARLAQAAGTILTAAGLDATGLTTPLEAPQHLQAGRLVLVINPPRVTYPTWDEVDAEWEAWLITGPAGDWPSAWDTLDQARDLLVAPLELASATPDAFNDGHGTMWPAIVLTFTSHHDNL